MLREIIRLAHDLEAPYVRIFAAWSGITMRDGQGVYETSRTYYQQPDVTHLEQWHWARECIAEASRWGEQYGVTLALQNHSPVTNTYKQTLEMIREVDSPWVKACIDAPLLTDQTDEAVYQAVLETGDLQVWSHFGGYEETVDGKISEETDKGTKFVNYPAFFKGLRDIGYQGYIAYEGCSPVLVNHNWMGIEEADRRAKLALDYMRRQIDSVLEKN
jgi:sugar phosphate isomerase/epimerase